MHKGKVYRIIWEPPALSHPTECICVIYNISNPNDPREIFRETCFDETKFASLCHNAELHVAGL
jgi:hypothetical protein